MDAAKLDMSPWEEATFNNFKASLFKPQQPEDSPPMVSRKSTE